MSLSSLRGPAGPSSASRARAVPLARCHADGLTVSALICATWPTLSAGALAGRSRARAKKGAPPPTQEDLDVERYRLTADLAVADAEELRRVAARQQQQLDDAARADSLAKDEADELYEYLDAQMLSTARDRQTTEQELHSLRLESQREYQELEQQLHETKQTMSTEISQLRAELAVKDKELHELHDFRNVRPAMELELKGLRQQLVDERAAIAARYP